MPAPLRAGETGTVSPSGCTSVLRRPRPQRWWGLVAGLVLVAAGTGCRIEGGTLFIDSNMVNSLFGWDLSACGPGFNTCLELVADNQQQLVGGSINDSVENGVLDLLNSSLFD